MKTRALPLSSIAHVQTISEKHARIVGISSDGVQAEIDFPRSEAIKLALQCLWLAVTEATPTPIPTGSTIPEVYMPVMKWECFTVAANGEPGLAIEVAGGARLLFQFPWQAAQTCGQDLAAKGQLAAPASGSKPS
jgi:hypothetical protein